MTLLTAKPASQASAIQQLLVNVLFARIPSALNATLRTQLGVVHAWSDTMWTIQTAARLALRIAKAADITLTWTKSIACSAMPSMAIMKKLKDASHADAAALDAKPLSKKDISAARALGAHSRTEKPRSVRDAKMDAKFVQKMDVRTMKMESFLKMALFRNA